MPRCNVLPRVEIVDGDAGAGADIQTGSAVVAEMNLAAFGAACMCPVVYSPRSGPQVPAHSHAMARGGPYPSARPTAPALALAAHSGGESDGAHEPNRPSVSQLGARTHEMETSYCAYLEVPSQCVDEAAPQQPYKRQRRAVGKQHAL